MLALVLALLTQLPPPLAKPLPALHVYPTQNTGLPIIGAGECTGSALLGSRGETVTFTRSSAATCENSAGVVVALTTDQPATMRGTLRREAAATFLGVWPRDLSRAATWTLTGATCAKTSTGKTGVANSASICEATADDATLCQAITVASAARTTSLDVQVLASADGGGSSGSLALARDGVTFVALDATNCANPLGVGTAPGTSAFTRCQRTTTLANPTICLELALQGDRVAVDYFSDEAGAFATSRCDNSGSSCTRAAAAVSVANPLTDNPGQWCVATTIAPLGALWTGSGSRYIASSGTHSAANSWRMYVLNTANLSLVVYDAAGAAFETYTSGAISDAQHVVAACNAGGTTTLWVDGAKPAKA